MLKQSLQQKLQQKLSPQQIQLMKLLQVPTLELEARIKEELEANPALEEGAENDWDEDDLAPAEEQSEALDDFDFDDYLDDATPDYRLSARNQGADVEDKTIPFSGGTTFLNGCMRSLVCLMSRRKPGNWLTTSLATWTRRGTCAATLRAS